MASIDDVYRIMVPRTWSTLFADHRMNSESQYLRGVSTPMSEGLIIYYKLPPVLFFRESLNKPNAKHFVSSILSSPFQSPTNFRRKKHQGTKFLRLLLHAIEIVLQGANFVAQPAIVQTVMEIVFRRRR